MAQPQGLALYHYMSCSYCARVRAAAEGLGVELELRDIHTDPGRADELMSGTGRMTVPVLQITEPGGEVSWLPESASIIEYLHEEGS